MSESNSPHWRMLLSQSIDILASIKGDILVAVLFLPVALTFQNLAQSFLSPTQPCATPSVFVISAVTKLVIIFVVLVPEFLAISLVLLNWKKVSRRIALLIGLSIVVFTVAITVMGYVTAMNTAFRLSLIISLLATSWGPIYLIKWDNHTILAGIILMTVPIISLTSLP